jgi:hypothetical protein
VVHALAAALGFARVRQKTSPPGYGASELRSADGLYPNRRARYARHRLDRHIGTTVTKLHDERDILYDPRRCLTVRITENYRACPRSA